MSQIDDATCPVAWICDDDLVRLREHGCATVYEHEQQFVILPPVRSTPLYARRASPGPEVAIPLLLFCPACNLQHIDRPQPEKDWTNPPHRSHECQGCGYVWRPSDHATTGVESIRTRGKVDHGSMPWREAPAPSSEVAAAIELTDAEMDGLINTTLPDFGPSSAIFFWRRELRLVARAFCAAASRAPGPPREPTQAMQDAGVAAMFDRERGDLKRRELMLIVRKGWRAMYAAAEAAPGAT